MDVFQIIPRANIRMNGIRSVGQTLFAVFKGLQIYYQELSCRYHTKALCVSVDRCTFCLKSFAVKLSVWFPNCRSRLRITLLLFGQISWICRRLFTSEIIFFFSLKWANPGIRTRMLEGEHADRLTHHHGQTHYFCL